MLVPARSYGQGSASQAGRGYHILYHFGETNRCPSCGRTHWHIGRTTAECANCETAIPLAVVSKQSAAPRIFGQYSKTAWAA